MKPIKAIFFDLDGTLLDTIEDLKTAVNYAMDSFGFPHRTYDEIRCFVGNGMQNLINRSLPVDVSDSSIQKQALDIFLDYYGAHLIDFTKPYSGVVELMTKLKDLGYIVAIVSNKEDLSARKVCRHFFHTIPDYVIGESDELARKPAPDMIKYLLSSFKLKPDEVVLVGDSDVDAKTALNAKVPFVAVTWGFRTRRQLEEVGATLFINYPNELLEVLNQ